LYSGVTKTNASKEAIFAAHALVCGWLYYHRRRHRFIEERQVEVLISTTSNSASLRFFAMS